MDAVKLLTDDHRKVKQLLRKYEDVKDDLPAKRALAEQIIRELMVHERIEEDVFYPAYRNAADEEGKALVAESKEEHHVVDNLLDELQAVDLDDERFDAKFKVLKENVEHHIREEEGEMFPDARKLLGANKLNELGDVMAELKANMMREVAPRREEKH